MILDLESLSTFSEGFTGIGDIVLVVPIKDNCIGPVLFLRQKCMIVFHKQQDPPHLQLAHLQPELQQELQWQLSHLQLEHLQSGNIQ